VLANNQIDDLIRISPAPYTITYVPISVFTVTSIGTYRKFYQPGAMSRFFPTKKNFFAASSVTTESETGDEVVDTKSTDITAVSQLYTRLAWGVVTESTEFSGKTVLKVDFADGSEGGFDVQAEKYARPPFKVGMECVVQRRDGTFINDAASPVTISALAANQVTLTSAITADAEVGTTIYRSPIDASGLTGVDTLTYYLFGRDFFFNGDNGQIVYMAEFTPLMNTPLIPDQALSGIVNLVNKLTAPLQFPALYGGTEDDDGDLSFPIQTPDPNSEQNGYLYTEDKLIHISTGLIRTITTPPFVGLGSTPGASNVITNLAGPYLAPLPQVNDIAVIRTGANASTIFRRITAVGASTITVAGAVLVVDPSFTYEIAVSASTATGTGNVVVPVATASVLNDAAASFLTTVQVGQTVVGTSGANLGLRRQVLSIASATQLTVTPAFPATMAGMTYRVDNSLATYGGTSNDYLAELVAALNGELALYPDEQQYILDFLDQVFTNVIDPPSNTGSTAAAVLTDLNATFLTDEVSTAHFVYIETGLNAGFYRIASVGTQTQLTVTTLFPAVLGGMTYRIVKLFGISPESVDALLALNASIDALLVSAASFLAIITAPYTVLGDASAFARGTLASDLDTRDGLVDARITAIPTDLATVQNMLVSTDRLYDTRYTWIDARINLESGLVVQQATATVNRIKEQANIFKQLVKLLAVEAP